MAFTRCSIVVILCVVLGISIHLAPVHAWGSDGHKIVAQIALSYLTPSAANKVNQQLANGVKLPDIASSPDDYSHSTEGKWSGSDHYVDVADNATMVTIRGSSCEEGCVITAIMNYTTRLEKARNGPINGVCQHPIPSDQAPCDLSFVVHYLGDIHQPMHLSWALDHGGNNFAVSFFNKTTNLHSLWDSGLISHYLNGSGWTNLANELLHDLAQNPKVVSALQQQLDPRTWANESFALTRNVCYNFMPGVEGIAVREASWRRQNPSNSRNDANHDHHSHEKRSIQSSSSYVTLASENYYIRNIRVVKERLAAAGVRLAAVLNAVYATTDNNNNNNNINININSNYINIKNA